VPTVAAATATYAANLLRLVAGAAVVARPANAAILQNRRRCAAIPPGSVAGERAAGKGAYPTAALERAPTDAVVQPVEVADECWTALCATATGASCIGAGCHAAGAAPPSAAATPLSHFPASDGWLASLSGAPGVLDARLVAAVGAAAVAAVPVDHVAPTAGDGDGADPRLFADPQSAAAASSVPASARTEASVASRPPALAEAGTDAAPAPGTMTIPRRAGGICGGGGGDTTPSSPVTACQLSSLCDAAPRAARRPVAGVVAAETAWRPLLVGGTCRGVERLGCPTHPAATVPCITGRGAVGRWPLNDGGGSADATSPPRRYRRGGAPRQSAARRGLEVGGSGGGGGGGGASRPMGCRKSPRRTHVPMPLGHGARDRSRHTSHTTADGGDYLRDDLGWEKWVYLRATNKARSHTHTQAQATHPLHHGPPSPVLAGSQQRRRRTGMGAAAGMGGGNSGRCRRQR